MAVRAAASRSCLLAAAVLFNAAGMCLGVPAPLLCSFHCSRVSLRLPQANFDAAYFGGNRAPMPIYINTAWLSQESHISGLRRFVGASRSVRKLSRVA